MPKITDKLVKELVRPEKGNKVVYDEGFQDRVRGFGARITAGGARAFVLRYVYAGDRKEYRFTIGAFPDLNSTAARDEASKLLSKMALDRNWHPMLDRRKASEVVTVATPETYAEAVEDYIKREQIGRRGNSTAPAVRRSLLVDGAEWLDKPISGIKSAELRKALELMRDGDDAGKPPIAARPYQANRFHAFLTTFFRWCAEPGIDKVELSPMMNLRRPWEGESARNRYFNDDELKAIWRAADKIGGVGGSFLKVAMLTGKRKGALSAMKWAEVSEDEMWTPPSSNRLKKSNKRLHAVPLPKLAMRNLPTKPKPEEDRASDYVFLGRVRGTHLDPGTPLQAKICKDSGISDFMFHALRHTVETRLAELGVQPHIRDLVLDHAPMRGSGGGYDHYHYIPEMREALERWATHIEGLIAPEGVRVLR
jgi:integrase